MTERRGGQYIPHETRHDANEILNRNLRYRQIVECLKDNPQTAKELACTMLAKGYIPYCDRNFTAPRLTELTYKGIVEPIGKKTCKWTKREVAVYALRELK